MGLCLYNYSSIIKLHLYLIFFDICDIKKAFTFFNLASCFYLQQSSVIKYCFFVPAPSWYLWHLRSTAFLQLQGSLGSRIVYMLHLLLYKSRSHIWFPTWAIIGEDMHQINEKQLHLVPKLICFPIIMMVILS